MAARDRAQQVAVIRELVAIRAPLGEQWQQIADLALQSAELSLARAAIELFVEASDGAPFAQFRKAGVLEQCGATAEAYALLCSLPDDTPTPAANAYSRGIWALQLGQLEEARQQLERVVRLQPNLGVAWVALASSFDLAREGELADHIMAAERHMASAAPAHRAAYYYALGKTHADRAERAPAIGAFAIGARELKSLVPFSLEADRRNAAEALDGSSAETLAALSRKQSEATARAIFVTGLPRSGTSLIEQVLTNHSSVGDGGEINRLLLLAGEIGGHSLSAVRRYVDAQGSARAARLFGHWMEERFPGAGRIVDKSLTTTRLLGLAASLLPEAPLIWMTREPLDCAWSCFRTFFQGTNPWSHDLEDMAAHFRIEEQLLRQWQDILGDRLLVVPYESVVAEPQLWIRTILSHCGLTEEPPVFTPHTNPRMVRTASMMQVRRPINSQGVGSAEPYREFLQPFVAAYRN
jgi:hypothetical protein